MSPQEYNRTALLNLAEKFKRALIRSKKYSSLPSFMDTIFQDYQKEMNFTDFYFYNYKIEDFMGKMEDQLNKEIPQADKSIAVDYFKENLLKFLISAENDSKDFPLKLIELIENSEKMIKFNREISEISIEDHFKDIFDRLHFFFKVSNKINFDEAEQEYKSIFERKSDFPKFSLEYKEDIYYGPDNFIGPLNKEQKDDLIKIKTKDEPIFMIKNRKKNKIENDDILTTENKSTFQYHKHENYYSEEEVEVKCSDEQADKCGHKCFEKEEKLCGCFIPKEKNKIDCVCARSHSLCLSKKKNHSLVTENLI